jgi:ribonuclease HI/pterin-4a-carbinolamine dehydratase
MWQETNNSLYSKIEFRDFDEAMAFIEKVAQVARNFDHHPTITNTYNIVELWLTTHSAGNKITAKDQEVADAIEKLLELPGEGSDVILTKAKLYGDGGSRGNPGPSALGYAILDMQDNVVKKEGIYLGITTNNQAEYRALLVGLENALQMGVKELHVYMDSLLVINQVQGIWKIKNQELLPLHTAIRKLLPKFDHVALSHVPRALNSLADSMVNEALDAVEDDAAVIS